MRPVNDIVLLLASAPQAATLRHTPVTEHTGWPHVCHRRASVLLTEPAPG